MVKKHGSTFLNLPLIEKWTMIIGLDVGGTHADAVLLGKEGILKELKIPTDRSDLFQTVLTCLDQITTDVDITDIQRIVLSTTLTTNAIAQDNIPQVGVIVSCGPGIQPDFYRTNPHYFPVSGSIDHRGREITPVDPEEIKHVSQVLQKNGIAHVGVIGKFSVRNPGHEVQIARALQDSFERVFMGHQISGSLNFARRIATTYLNAAMYPIHRQFFDAVRRSLQEKGLNVPIHILKADGGTMNLDASMAFPGQTILSGPAASVMGSVAFAPPDAEAVTLDIGGTTTDIAIIDRGVPLLHPLGIRLAGFRTLIRSLETRSIAIGGDSAVEVADGKLQVGPRREGPAMAYGGSVPTPTDALSVLGLLQEGDRAAALRGIEAVAARLGMETLPAADLIVDHTAKVILAAVDTLVERINNRPVYTVHELQSGKKLSPDRLLVLGGPAPYFAERFKKIGRHRVSLIPRWQVANAIGAALARTTCEVSLFADTQLGLALSPEEDYEHKIGSTFNIDDALASATALLRQKALQLGAHSQDLETEVLEAHQFNMVRGFLTTGYNIRVKVQVKPGLIQAHEKLVGKLAVQ
jgi:N-methylhydantoinase A/oxoprolinase/acetone carboxylase beta subunit